MGVSLSQADKFSFGQHIFRFQMDQFSVELTHFHGQTEIQMMPRLAKMIPRYRHFHANSSLSDMASPELAMAPSGTNAELIIFI